MGKSTGKQKLCWNCEGNVSKEAENCPFCGVYLSPITGQEDAYQMNPPYPISDENEEDTVPESPYMPEKEELSTTVSLEISDFKAILLPLCFLLSGSVFFLFSFVLYLFSDQGVLSLQWKTTYWYVYFLGSIVLLLIGGFFFQKFTEIAPESKPE